VKPNSSPSPEPIGTTGLLHTFAASLAVLVIGVALLFDVTDHGRSFTTESLRRGQVVRKSIPIPNLLTMDQHGDRVPLRQWLAQDNRVVILDFVYTRCQSLCSSLGSIYQQMQAELIARGLQKRVSLLSISFDPVHDQPQALAIYALRMGMQPESWQILSLATVQDRRALLDAFGIMVIPAPLGEFEHNAALHIVSPRGELVQIVDYTSPGLALSTAMTMKP